MAKTRFHSLLEHKINERVESRIESTISGAAEDYARYREQVGYISGLKDALRLAEDVEREME